MISYNKEPSISVSSGARGCPLTQDVCARHGT
jgi:hypothetical protein